MDIPEQGGANEGRICRNDQQCRPLAALEVGELPEPQPRPFWSTVSVKAATVNHHDIWSLKGVGLAADATPMILGTDAARRARRGHSRAQGLKAGDEVVLYTVIAPMGPA